ncbi:Autoinducer 2 import ATP-binding protein LsrA [Leclercia adecarboxylata]|uniref:Autoinducer 2 import ATP-binding protein LsrA n=1 Tax=Leclercia adecarboxylata TaxID=83655 RepID=A0A4U9IP74_9ENTR|nr:Autoinducer 2 import ATP-binding protein LsrA [Leclercia adecarboxylata]
MWLALPGNRRTQAQDFPVLRVESLTGEGFIDSQFLKNLRRGNRRPGRGWWDPGAPSLPKRCTACARRAEGRSGSKTSRSTTIRSGTRLEKGLVYLPEDRQVSGLFLDAPVRWNTVALNEPSLWQQRKREAAVVERYHRALGIKLNGPDQTVRTLSGGNQQKVLLARCLEANPLLLIVDEPTRGVDVSARADIYQLIKSVAAQNVAVLMISSDMDEVPGSGGSGAGHASGGAQRRTAAPRRHS